MKFSIIHASARPEEWEKSALAYFENSSGKHEIEYILVTEPTIEWPLDGLINTSRIKGTTPKSSVAHWNLGASKATGDIIILNSDDMFPSKEWDEKLAEKFVFDEFTIPAVIRVGYKEESQPGLITLQIMTKAYYKMMGYAMYSGFESVFADNDFTACAEELGVIIEAPEIVWEHRHPFFTKKEFDSVYQTENETKRYSYGSKLFEFRKKLGYKAILGLEKHKPTPKAITPRRDCKIVALAYPGTNFDSSWVTDWSQLIGYAFAMNIGTILCPAKGNSTHIIRNNQIVEAEGAGVPYDYFFSIDSDQLNAHGAFKELFETMESHPEIDVLAAWSWMESGNINCGRFDKNPQGEFIRDEDGVYQFSHVSESELEDSSSPIELDWIGFGCFIVRRKVIQEIGPGLFSAIYKDSWMSDDEGFCLRALDKGFRIFVHPKVEVPHLKLQVLKSKGKEKAIGNSNYSGNS